MAAIISRGWEAGVKALDRAAASAAADGLDSGRASARLLQSGECHLGNGLNGLHTQIESLIDFVRVGVLLYCGLLGGL